MNVFGILISRVDAKERIYKNNINDTALNYYLPLWTINLLIIINIDSLRLTVFSGLNYLSLFLSCQWHFDTITQHQELPTNAL